MVTVTFHIYDNFTQHNIGIQFGQPMILQWYTGILVGLQHDFHSDYHGITMGKASNSVTNPRCFLFLQRLINTGHTPRHRNMEHLGVPEIFKTHICTHMFFCLITRTSIALERLRDPEHDSG